MENVIYSIQSDKITPLVIRNIITETPFASARPIDKKALEKNHEFVESIKHSRQWFMVMVGLYEETEQEIVTLRNSIDDEIANR